MRDVSPLPAPALSSRTIRGSTARPPAFYDHRATRPHRLRALGLRRRRCARRLRIRGPNLDLAVTVRAASVRAFVGSLAKKVAQPPVDSRLLLRDLTPYLTPERPGLALIQSDTERAIASALRLNARDRITLHAKKTRADV